MPVHKAGKGHKGIRAAKNAFSGKYKKQRIRTNANKKKRWKKHIEAHPNDNLGKKNIEKAENKLHGV